MVDISVVIPTFKRVEQTVRTIQLLLDSEGIGKSFDLELIVSDSTPDESLHTAVSTRFGPTLVYVRPEKPGIATNKNAGAKAAKHPILLFCDSDMEVQQRTILYAMESLQRHDTAGMVGGVVLWRGGPNDGHKDRPRSEDRMMQRGEITYVEALYSRFVMTYAKVFWDVGGYDETAFNMRGEGSDLSARYWRAGYPLVYDSDIRVHHIHEAPDSAALRVEHPEWAIAKDLVLLAYKYNMFDKEYLSFASTVAMNFVPYGTQGAYRFLQGIVKHYDLLAIIKPALDAFRASDTPVYDFKFLEVFSQTKLFEACLAEAKARIVPSRENMFNAV